MTMVSIPNWTAQGVLPPIDMVAPTSPNRSPYRASLTDFVLHFGISAARCRIIDGLLRYRTALHGLGLTVGFQWVDGSFLEQVELLESRPPNDIDVVTFYRLPPGENQRSLQTKAPDLLDHGHVKVNYHVDAYLVSLDSSPEHLVGTSAYWYSVWSHRRNQAWKGYVEVDLGPGEDGTAQTLLTTLPGTGGTP